MHAVFKTPLAHYSEKNFCFIKIQKLFLVPREFITCLRASFSQLEAWQTEELVDDNEYIYAK